MGKILFSAIGTTDPFRNFHDGGWAHCLRWESPDRTVIYLSKMMCDYEDEHGFYSKAIDLMNEDRKKEGKPPIHLDFIRREGLTKPHIYGYLLKDFIDILTDLYTKNPDDEIIINVSSGTPAMKSCLADMKTFLPFSNKIRFLQVDAPDEGKDNQIGRTDKDYDLMGNWDCNEDRNSEAPKRVHPLETEERDVLLRMRYAKELIMEHEYHAARELIREDLPYYQNSDFVSSALVGADHRTMIHLHRAGTNLDKANISCRNLLQEADHPIRQCAEMVLTMINDVDRHDYANMLRKITPVMFVYTLYIFKEENGYDPTRYVDRRGHVDWDRLERDKEEYTAAIRRNGNGTLPRVSYLNTSLLLPGLRESTKYARAVEILTELREVESDGRCDAAHVIVGIDDAWIREKTELNSRQILARLKELIQIVEPKYDADFWNDYHDMDQKICDMMKLKSIWDKETRKGDENE